MHSALRAQNVHAISGVCFFGSFSVLVTDYQVVVPEKQALKVRTYKIGATVAKWASNPAKEAALAILMLIPSTSVVLFNYFLKNQLAPFGKELHSWLLSCKFPVAQTRADYAVCKITIAIYMFLLSLVPASPSKRPTEIVHI
jgi:hypothetical protein